jgi:plastocyanin
MKKLAKHSLLPVVPASLLGSPNGFRCPLRFGRKLKPYRSSKFTAKKYEYLSSLVHLKSGTKIQLKITATDHDHGIKISPVPDGALPNGAAGLIFSSAQDCWQLKKGETTTIEFLAQAPGTYTFKCCHTCGLGHRGMKGQIVVD